MADPTGPVTHRPRGFSLQRWLSRDLAIMILAISALATGISFFVARNEANELQDNELKQIAHLYRPGDAAVMQFPRHPRTDAEADSLVRIWPQSQWARLDITAIPDGFGDVRLQGGLWRMYKESRPDGSGVAVLQATDLRNELATGSALRTLLPLLFLTPVLVLLTRRTLTRAFRPVHRVIEQIDRRPPQDLSPVQMNPVIEEIQPFVGSINGLLRRVDSELARQKRFIADAAHELRTPLAALRLQVDNLSRVESVAAMHERLSPLHAGLRRMQHLVNQLLTLARNQAGGTLHLEEVDMAAVAREVTGGLVFLARDKAVDLGLFVPESAPVRAQPGDIDGLLQALLENAIKYTPAGGQVNVRLRTDAGGWLLEVEDSGPGIPDALLESVTEPFFRASAGDSGGSGLGLSIAEGVARRYGGRLVLGSRAGDRTGLLARYWHPGQRAG